MLSKITNYNVENVKNTVGFTEGFGRFFSLDRALLEEVDGNEDESTIALREMVVETNENGYKTADYVINLEGGILNCNQPLLNNTEVKLSFDRALAAVSLLYAETGSNVKLPTDLDGKVIELIDPYLEVEYVTSSYLRNFYSQIEERPISLKYDDVNIYMRNINKGSSTIRVNNIMGGPSPDYIFAGFVKTEALNGSFEYSATNFGDSKFKEVSLTLNGMPVQGFPITIPTSTRPVRLYDKFLKTIGKNKKTMAGGTIEFRQFTRIYQFISHNFEGEPSTEGWIGLEMKLEIPLTHDVTLVIFAVRNSAVVIDKFHRIQQIQI